MGRVDRGETSGALIALHGSSDQTQILSDYCDSQTRLRKKKAPIGDAAVTVQHAAERTAEDEPTPFAAPLFGRAAQAERRRFHRIIGMP
jgi:hypothetical protein